MRKFKNAALIVCIVETIIMVGGLTACRAKNDNHANVPQQTAAASEAQTQQETKPQNELQQETALPSEMQQGTAPSDETQPAAAQISETQQTAVQSNTAQQNTNQPVQGDTEQISLETAKSAALTDAGVSAADVIFTKEKLDYEDGIAVYDIEFYAGNTEYEYEINAATGAVHSKSMETHHNRNGHGHSGNAGTATTQTDIGTEGATLAALGHAGFLASDVSRLKAEFDIDDGLSIYEVEFYKDGREYEYKINAADGSVIEYDID